jgi:phosphate transport system substrate-binding protein
MMINKVTPTILLILVAFIGASSSVARENVEVVGSSTVYPFATVVAERYGRASGKPTPKIEST